MDLVKLIIEAEAPPALVSEDLGELKKLPPDVQKYMLQMIKWDATIGADCAVWPVSAPDAGSLNKAINKVMDEMAAAGVSKDDDFRVYAAVVTATGEQYVIRKHGRADRRYTVYSYQKRSSWSKDDELEWVMVSDKKGNTLDSVYAFRSFDHTAKAWVIGPDIKRLALRSQRWKDQHTQDPLAKSGGFTGDSSTVDGAAAKAMIAKKVAEALELWRMGFNARLAALLSKPVSSTSSLSNFLEGESRRFSYGYFTVDVGSDGRAKIDAVKTALASIKKLAAT